VALSRSHPGFILPLLPQQSRSHQKVQAQAVELVGGVFLCLLCVLLQDGIFPPKLVLIQEEPILLG
jgi:hypothetical protein